MIYKVKETEKIVFEGQEIDSFIIFMPHVQPWKKYNDYGDEFCGLFGKLRNGSWFTAYSRVSNLTEQLDKSNITKAYDKRQELKYRLAFNREAST